MQNKLKWSPILIMPFLLTGCWDSVEINERNVVLEVAIDKNQDIDKSQPINKRDSYQITYTIPDIGKLSGEDSLAKDVKTSIVTVISYSRYYCPALCNTVYFTLFILQASVEFLHCL